MMTTMTAMILKTKVQKKHSKAKCIHRELQWDKIPGAQNSREEIKRLEFQNKAPTVQSNACKYEKFLTFVVL